MTQWNQGHCHFIAIQLRITRAVHAHALHTSIQGFVSTYTLMVISLCLQSGLVGLAEHACLEVY